MKGRNDMDVLIPIRKSEVSDYEKKPVLLLTNDEHPEFQWVIICCAKKQAVSIDGKCVEACSVVTTEGKASLALDEYGDTWFIYEYDDVTKNIEVV